MTTVIGVDPGKTGARVAIRTREANELFPQRYEVLFVKDNRDFQHRTEGIMPIGCVVIERQQYMSKGGRRQGAKSAFSLGHAFGFWLGYYAHCQIIEVSPKDWQRYHFGAGTVITNPKERSIRQARRLLPELELVPPGCRVPSHGRADAALIALFGLAVVCGKQHEQLRNTQN